MNNVLYNLWFIAACGSAVGMAAIAAVIMRGYARYDGVRWFFSAISLLLSVVSFEILTAIYRMYFTRPECMTETGMSIALIGRLVECAATVGVLVYFASGGKRAAIRLEGK